MDFLTLPWEDVIVSCIMPYLSLKDCYNLSLIGKSYHMIVQIYLSKLKKLRTNDVFFLSTNSFQKIASMTHMLEEIDLSHCDNVNDDIIKILIENNPNIVYLDLSSTRFIFNDASIHKLRFSKNLMSFKLKNCPWITPECLFTLNYYFCQRPDNPFFIGG